MSTGSTQSVWPVRPWTSGFPLCGRFRHYVNLCYCLRLLPVTASHTIGAGITAPDYQNVFVLCTYPLLRGNFLSCNYPVLLRQEFHCEMNALQVPAFYINVAGLL